MSRSRQLRQKHPPPIALTLAADCDCRTGGRVRLRPAIDERRRTAQLAVPVIQPIHRALIAHGRHDEVALSEDGLMRRQHFLYGEGESLALCG